MDPRTREMLDGSLRQDRSAALAALAGIGAGELVPMGRGEGTVLTDPYGQRYLDFSTPVLVTGHNNKRVFGYLSAQIQEGPFKGGYGHYLEHFPVAYAQALSARFPPDRQGQPRRVLVMSSTYEARAVAAQLCLDPETGPGAHVLSLLDADGVPREGGEVQDEVHRARAQQLKIVADETVTGFGRTGTFCHYQYYGITPDVVVLGPSGGGGLPFAAVVAPGQLFYGPVYDQVMAIVRTDGVANPLVCAAALGVLDQLDDELLGQVCRIGKTLEDELGSVWAQFPHVLTGIAGVGCHWVLRLAETARAPEFVRRCREAGLLISPQCLLTPPLTVTEQEVRTAVDALAAACIDMGG